jgi:hypothetical protein
MVPGFEHDDAYIMVEHDLIEAAKEVTRQLHLEAYLRQAAVPVTGDIARPTMGRPGGKAVVEEESGVESDSGDGKAGGVRWVGVRRVGIRRAEGAIVKMVARDRSENQRTNTSVKRKASEMNSRGKANVREATKEKVVDEPIRVTSDEDDSDDEDLDKPIRKKVPPCSI